MSKLKMSLQKIVEQKAIKNLLFAQERIADEGSVRDLIRVTKYLLQLSKKFDDVLVDVVPEGNEEWGSNPVD